MKSFDLLNTYNVSNELTDQLEAIHLGSAKFKVRNLEEEGNEF